METSGLCFELARLTGTESRQGTWLDRFGHWRGSDSDIRSQLDAMGLEPSDSFQFLRLPADLSGSSTWIKYHCQVANQSQSFYRSISREQWLRTLIVSSRPVEIFDSSEANLIIHSNVVPRQAYPKAPCLKRQQCRGFSPAGDGSRIPRPRSCENCALAEHMSRTEIDCMPADELDKLPRFWFLEVEEVELVDDLGGGSEGQVSKILWRKGVFVRKRFPCGSQQNENMNRELDVALKVSHPNIVHCFGVSRGVDPPYCDLFMELLDADLEWFLSETSSVPSFSFKDLLSVLLQVARAMKYLHEKNLVHGDLKPQNIFVSCFELAHSGVQYYLVKVGDFGCAQGVDSSGATVEPFKSKIGTTKYLAPEVWRCRRYEEAPPKHPQKIDVYSFGVVAYQVLTGIPLVYEGCKFDMEEVIQGRLRPDIDYNGTQYDDCDSSLLLSLCRRCWTSNPEDRPSFSQICDELDAHLVKHDDELEKMNGLRECACPTMQKESSVHHIDGMKWDEIKWEMAK